MTNKRDIKRETTFCNPLPIPDIPRGKDLWYPYEDEMFSHENKPESVTVPDYRSISDPTVFYDNGKWYLYPSYGMAWVSDNFTEWKSVRTDPYCPKYSPAITQWKGKYLLTSWNCPLYIGDSPVGLFTKLGKFIGTDGKEFTICDPALFTDDDGRLYAYGFSARREESFKYFYSQIIGYELDTEDPRKVLKGPVVLYEMNPEKYPWERFGAHGQNTKFGWVEGVHMLKYRRRYYAIYAAPNTEYPNYCMAVLYSDEGPMSGFVSQKRNPLTANREGIVRGAGHGCVEKGPNDTLWAFYTVSTPYYFMFERRIGMDLVAVDENGELYCPGGVTDTPQFAPGYLEDPTAEGNGCGYYNLTDYIRPEASTCAPGRDALFANDATPLSFWQPADDDLSPTLVCFLDHSYRCGASRIFWREVGLDYGSGVRPGPVKYVIEGCNENAKENWFILIDCSDNDTDYNIDYRVFPEKECRYVRLRITDKPKGLKIGVIDFSVFGVLAD